MKHFLFALATLVGTIIGVGLFGLPYVASKTGFFIVIIFFIVIGFLINRLQLMFAEITNISGKEKHQLPGYIEKFLGKKAKSFAMLVLVLSSYGALLAYIIIGGEFLYELLSPTIGGTVILYQMCFFLIGAWLIHKGLSSIAETEFIMLAFLFITIIILAIVSFPQVELVNLKSFTPKNFFLPYGVIIFSLWGLNVIPTIKEYLNDDIKKLKKVLSVGIIVCILVYILFITIVLGVSGEKTSIEALNGLVPLLSPKILLIGYIFGILTTFTSFITIGLVLKKGFIQDYQFPHSLSWFLTLFIPLVVFSLGVTNFIYVINLTGAITLAFQGILISLIYIKLLKHDKYKKLLKINISKTMVYAITTILTLGILSEIIFTIKG